MEAIQQDGASYLDTQGLNWAAPCIVDMNNCCVCFVLMKTYTPWAFSHIVCSFSSIWCWHRKETRKDKDTTDPDIILYSVINCYYLCNVFHLK